MIRPVPIDDDDQVQMWCDVWNLVRAFDGRTPIELRYEAGLDPHTELWLVHDVSARPIAAVRLTDSRWTAQTEQLQIKVATVPGASGVVPTVLDTACRRARQLGSHRLGVECRAVRADDGLRRELMARGSTLVDRDVVGVLDMQRAVTWRSALPTGTSLTTLAERPELAESACRCFCLADEDEPTMEAAASRPLTDWMRDFESPWTSLDDCLLAVTDASEVIGWASLERYAMSPDVGWNGFTGTHPDHRRRGIAGHLKLALLDYARNLGLRELRTENHEHNLAMRHLNARMGYVPSHANEWWRIDL